MLSAYKLLSSKSQQKRVRVKKSKFFVSLFHHLKPAPQAMLMSPWLTCLWLNWWGTMCRTLTFNRHITSCRQWWIHAHHVIIKNPYPFEYKWKYKKNTITSLESCHGSSFKIMLSEQKELRDTQQTSLSKIISHYILSTILLHWSYPSNPWWHERLSSKPFHRAVQISAVEAEPYVPTITYPLASAH